MNRNPISRLMGAMAFAVMAMAGAAEKQAAQAFKASHMVPPTSRTVGSSRNGGHRGGNRAHQRAAVKKRNQQRHRKACRG